MALPVQRAVAMGFFTAAVLHYGNTGHTLIAGVLFPWRPDLIQ
jgi:hypothetical protein